MKEYVRFHKPSQEGFDPVEVAKETEEIVVDGCKRKYTGFWPTGVYGGIATGATGWSVGCCFRCIFCWSPESLNYPEIYGELYTPKEAFEGLVKASKGYKFRKARLSGSEPCLGKGHLLKLLEEIERLKFALFILETNGIMFGIDRDYVEKISRFSKVHVRLSLKAGTPEDFSKKTGAKPEFFEVPFKAIENLLDRNASFHVAAMSADPRVVRPEERKELLKKLEDIYPKIALNLEEEVVDPYRNTLKRLKHAGKELEWPLRRVYS